MNMFRNLTLVVLYNIVLGTCAASQISEQFVAVKVAGRSQCSTDQPFLTQRARSIIECSILCTQLLDEGCAAFNFKKDVFSCELFFWVKRYNVELPGCTLYEVQSIKWGCVVL